MHYNGDVALSSGAALCPVTLRTRKDFRGGSGSTTNKMCARNSQFETVDSKRECIHHATGCLGNLVTQIMAIDDLHPEPGVSIKEVAPYAKYLGTCTAEFLNLACTDPHLTFIAEERLQHFRSSFMEKQH